MRNTNVTVSLDTRRIKSDGTFPIVLRIGHNARTTAISLGISVAQKDWDESKAIVRKSYSEISGVTRLNNLIQKHKTAALDVILKLQELGKLDTLTVVDLRDRIAKKDSTDSFFDFAERKIQELLATNRIGTARSYKGTIAVLKKYNKGRDLRFREITFSFLTGLETNHKRNGNGPNGLAVYMRTIRAIFNQSIKEGLADKEAYPFDNYKIKTEPTKKRALDWPLLQSIIELKLLPGHRCFNARNYFLASYMMYGMNYTDMAYLKKEDIKNGRIVYRRRKTAKLYDIRITDSLSKLLDHYNDPESEYLFPIIKRQAAAEQEKDIQWARKRYNKKLKELAALCGIDQNLTSYVSRHSFATQAMLKQVPLAAISAMLGHSSIKTTEVYLKTLPSNILDQYNETIISM